MRVGSSLGRCIVGVLVAVAGATAAHATAVPGSWGRGASATTPADRLDPPPRTFSLVATGDWLAESRVLVAAASAAPPGVRYDHVPLLAPVQPVIGAADLAICHMETPIGAPGEPAGFAGRAAIGGYTLIRAPFELAADLRRLGFDRCSTASNHSWDLGATGVATTLGALEGAGLSHVGTARTTAEWAQRTAPFDVRGVRVAHLSYARNSNTGFPADGWRLSHAADAATVADDVAEARRRGAEVVVVSLHVFVEMAPAPAPDDRSLVTAIAAASDVDLVVIHGPHTIQPMEVVDGTPVFWSLGNLASGMGVPGRGRYSDPRALDGLLAAVRFVEQPDARFAAEATPVLLCQMSASRTVYPGLAAVGATTTPTDERDDLAACLARSTPVVPGLR